MLRLNLFLHRTMYQLSIHYPLGLAGIFVINIQPITAQRPPALSLFVSNCYEYDYIILQLILFINVNLTMISAKYI